MNPGSGLFRVPNEPSQHLILPIHTWTFACRHGLALLACCPSVGTVICLVLHLSGKQNWNGVLSPSSGNKCRNS